MKKLVRSSWPLALLVALAGCEAPPAPTPDGGSVCGDDRDCDDGLYCTGTERCMPGAAGADALGCVASAPCAAPLVCSETTDSCVSSCPDGDRDGHTELSCGGDDCDDTVASAHPGAAEVCDAAGVDEDCDPETLGGTDADADGYVSIACCNPNLAGALHCGPDCDDAQPGVHPTEAEECNAIDDDCDTAIDEGVLVTFYADGDTDGFGADGSPIEACARPAGAADRGGDCDDTTASVNPSIPESCNDVDDDCDTSIDEMLTLTRYRDADGDGFGGGAAVQVCPGIGGYSDVGGDCDDTVLAVHPGATELCNDVDDDCNGQLDGPSEDIDHDGDAPASCGGTDCVPYDPAIHGGAVEVCDAVDQDCDPTTRADGDGDGHRDARGGCVGGPLAALPADDCDDTRASVFPGAAELCDGLDSDCDGTVDGAAADATCTAMGPPHESGTCHGASGCTYACATGYGECNASAPGCETNFRSPSTCGSCTNVCTAGLECDTGTCGPRAGWVFRVGSSGTDEVEGVARATSGHVFVAATTNATIDLGAGSLVSAGGTDGLVVALDANGTHRWSRRLGAAGDDRAEAIAADGTGGAVVVGRFSGTILLGSTMLVAHATAPETDGFVVAYDDAGSVRWSRALGRAGSGADAISVAAAAGRIAVGGVFHGTLVVDATTTLVARGSGLDYFVVVYDEAGTVLRARAFGAADVDDGLAGVAIDDAGRVAIGGDSAGFALDAIDFTGREISPGGFLLGLGADLTATWVDAPDCPDDGSAFAYSLSVAGAGGSSSGGICATSYFEGTCGSWGTARDGGESGAHCVDATGAVAMNEDFDERSVYPAGIWSDPTATWLVGTFGGILRGIGSGTGADDGFLARQAPASVATFVLRNTSGTSHPSEVTHGAGHLIVGGSFTGTLRVGTLASLAVAGTDGFVVQLDE